MKVNEICKVGFSRPIFNNDVIDGRGFVKTPPYQDKVISGQGCVKDIQKSRSLGVQPLKPLKGVNNVDKVHL